MKKKTKFLVMLLVFILFACILMQVKVLAAEQTININEKEDLVNAIVHQADGQTWKIKEGTYVLTKEDLAQYAEWGKDDPTAQQGNWYFPIHANDITIIGQGKVVITSDVETPNGNWASQDFISIWGNDVTIDGINIKCKKEQNKAIEVMGQNATLKNINLEKVDHNGSGSIIFNAQADGNMGNVTIENISLYSWISATYSKTGNLSAKNVTIDFTDNMYAGYHTEKNGYAWRPLINTNEGVTLNNTNFKLLVDDKINLTEQVFIDKLPENTTVVLTEDVAVDKMLNIKKDNVTLDLNNHTLTASKAFTDTYANHNDSHLLQVTSAKNVTIKNGSLVTTEKNKHGINLWDADSVILENLKIDNTKTMGGAPIIINNSTATVKGDLDLTIGENSWYGINVDPKEGSASLNFANGSSVSMTGGSSEKLAIQLDGDKNHISVSGTQAAGLATDESGNFMIEEVKPNDNNETTTPENNKGEEEKNPSTGDPFAILIVTLGISMIGMASVIYLKKKNVSMN